MNRATHTLILCAAAVLCLAGTATAELQNEYYGGDRIVHDPANGVYWYPTLTDTLDMTRAEQEAFISGLNVDGYARASDWKMATYDQVQALKDALAGMGTTITEHEWPWTPAETPRDDVASPWLAWPVQVDEFFTPTAVISQPMPSWMPMSILGAGDIMFFNGRTTGFGWRSDALGVPPVWADGEADDHFVTTEFKTPGQFATMTWNYDQHYLADDATTREGFPGVFGAWIVSKEGPDRTPLENQFHNGHRVVYDPYNGLYWYPVLTDTLDMTRAEQEEFIAALNEDGYADIYGWKMATSEQTQHLKDSLAAMGDTCAGHAWPWTPEGAERDMGSPFLAWSVRPDQFFTPTSIMEQPLPGVPGMILGGETMQVFNGRTTGPWWRTDVPTTPYAWQDGEADDHFVVTGYKTPGEFATMTFNYDVHYLADDATTRGGFPGPFGVWIVSEDPPQERGGLRNQWYAGDRVVYDTVNDVYFYPLMTKMLGMTKDQQQAYIDGLNAGAYATITDWHFANLEQMMALGMSASLDAQQLMGTTVSEGPVQFAPVRLDRYFEYTEHIAGVGGFPEHYLTMGRTAVEDEAVPVQMPSGAINWLMGSGQYHFPQLLNPETGKLEILMFDNDLNYVHNDATTSPMMGMNQQCSAWVVSTQGPNKGATDNNLFLTEIEGQQVVADFFVESRQAWQETVYPYTLHRHEAKLWYPTLADTFNMTLSEQLEFIDALEFAGVADWRIGYYWDTVPLKASIFGGINGIGPNFVVGFNSAVYFPYTCEGAGPDGTMTPLTFGRTGDELGDPALGGNGAMIEAGGDFFEGFPRENYPTEGRLVPGREDIEVYYTLVPTHGQDHWGTPNPAIGANVFDDDINCTPDNIPHGIWPGTGEVDCGAWTVTEAIPEIPADGQLHTIAITGVINPGVMDAEGRMVRAPGTKFPVRIIGVFHNEMVPTTDLDVVVEYTDTAAVVSLRGASAEMGDGRLYQITFSEGGASDEAFTLKVGVAKD